MFAWLKSLFKKKVTVQPLPKVNEKPKLEVVPDFGIPPEELRNKPNPLWYPLAIKYRTMKTKGTYPGAYPMGVVVHHTAGRSGTVDNAKACIDLGIENGYAYMDIASDGTVLQAHPLSHWGYHAGESAWHGLGKNVSDKLLGIEIDNAGRVEKVGANMFKTWFGTILTSNEVRYVTEAEWGCPTGYYHKYTQEQEQALLKLLVWLKENEPVKGHFNLDYILGHHEVAGKKGIGRWRKEDPGGSLSMPMARFREIVKQTYTGLGIA